MEAPLHLSPIGLPMPAPAPAPPRKQPDAIAAAVMKHAAAALQPVMAQNTPPPAMAGREQCPRCASRDTKFCYFNNYNTAQPRHFCRACRRYWTLGGSIRNVPVGGSTRHKRPRPARPTRALAAAVADATSPVATTTAAASSCDPLTSALNGGLLSSLLLGSAPLLEGRLGVDLGLGQPAVVTGDYLAQLGFGVGPLLWPIPTASQEPAWKAGGGMFAPPHVALWQEELAAAAPPMDHAGGLLLHQHHAVPPPLLL